jgi:hypothetical protein
MKTNGIGHTNDFNPTGNGHICFNVASESVTRSDRQQRELRLKSPLLPLTRHREWLVRVQILVRFDAFAPTGIGRRPSCFRQRMRDEQHRFLSLLGQLPVRLTAEQAAWVLNCQVHDIPILIASRLLKPLGNPVANSVKFFAAADILAHAKDRSWLEKVTATIGTHWHKQNSRKKRTPEGSHENELVSVLALTAQS